MLKTVMRSTPAGRRVDGRVGGGETVAHIHQAHDHVGAFDLLPGAGDADLLDLVGGLAQAGGVGDVERDAFDLDGFAQCVAGGAGDVGDDGAIDAGEAVEQAPGSKRSESDASLLARGFLTPDLPKT